jgi:hypothetical protein
MGTCQRTYSALEHENRRLGRTCRGLQPYCAIIWRNFKDFQVDRLPGHWIVRFVRVQVSSLLLFRPTTSILSESFFSDGVIVILVSYSGQEDMDDFHRLYAFVELERSDTGFVVKAVKSVPYQTVS